MLKFIDQQLALPMSLSSQIKTLITDKTYYYLKVDKNSLIPKSADQEEIVFNFCQEENFQETSTDQIELLRDQVLSK